MGNNASSELGPDAREAEEREAHAIHAAINEEIDRKVEEVKQRLRQERVAQLLDVRKTAAERNAEPQSTPGDKEQLQANTHKQSTNKDNKRKAVVESASEDEREHHPTPRKRKRSSRTRTLPPPLYKASVKELAEAGTIKVTGSTADIDDAIIARIKKCLGRANHPSTPEAEAKAALFMASRLMGQFNVSQAEVLAHETPDAQRQYRGHSIVSIQRIDRDKSKQVFHHGYLGTLAHAMDVLFDCKSYSSGRFSSLEFTFNGIAENTVAAAMAFEKSYNLIAEWARPYKGVGGKNSYRLGISDELERFSMEAKMTEEDEAKKAERDAVAVNVSQEKDERQAQLDRLASLPPSLTDRSSKPVVPVVLNGTATNPIWLDSEDDDTESVDNDLDLRDPGAEKSDEDCSEPDFTVIAERSLNPLAKLDEEINKLIKVEDRSPEPSLFLDLPENPASMTQDDNSQSRKDSGVVVSSGTSEEPHEDENGLDAKWASHAQLVKFRGTAKKIAEDYIKDQGIKLKAGSKRSSVIRDWKAYDKGVGDAVKIDVHRKQIKE